MQVFRSNIFVRSTAGSLILGLALAAFSGTARAEERSLDYSSWVRLHLPGSAPESVQSALALTSESGAHSLDEFLDTFLDEIRRSGSENDVAKWLYGKTVDHSIVRHDLRLRLMDVVSSVVLQRSLEVGLRSPLHKAKQRFGHGLLATTVRASSLRPENTESELPGASDHRISRFLISEAQPQGP
jgi:hypothetical protein